MRTVSNHTEANFLLIVLDLESVSVGLMLIPLISINKIVICVIECDLAGWTGKVESFHVVDENVLVEVLNAYDIAALIDGL